jgi:pyruvate dehydrogenase E2 component (dihydrolipoamide acetyltransferase)
VTPAARALAAERGIDLAALAGSGPEKAITREDVERAAAGRVSAGALAAGPAAPAPAETRGSAMRAAIAAAMARSKREIPHFYLTSTIDMRRAMRWLARRNEARPVAERLLPIALLIRAVALALRRHPQLNGTWTDGRFQPGAGIHVGSAIALRGGGLVAPAIRDADTKGVDVVMRELRDLTARVRAGSMRSSELADATITVTSLGDEGVDVVHGIIYPPQVALVGFGSLTTRPEIVQGRLQSVPVISATASVDHRAIDGRTAALFLAEVARVLQTPEEL